MCAQASWKELHLRSGSSLYIRHLFTFPPLWIQVSDLGSTHQIRSLSHCLRVSSRCLVDVLRVVGWKEEKITKKNANLLFCLRIAGPCLFPFLCLCMQTPWGGRKRKPKNENNFVLTNLHSSRGPGIVREKGALELATFSSTCGSLVFPLLSFLRQFPDTEWRKPLTLEHTFKGRPNLA